jgi:hypothetical protein
VYADGFRFAATTEQICLVRVAVGMTFALSAGVLFRGYYAGNTTPVQPLRIRRHSVGRYLRDCGGDCVLPLYGDRNFIIHWLQSWFFAWILMLPIVLFAAPAIRNLTNILTREE